MSSRRPGIRVGSLAYDELMEIEANAKAALGYPSLDPTMRSVVQWRLGDMLRCLKANDWEMFTHHHQQIARVLHDARQDSDHGNRSTRRW